jgi:hypothetical protein
MNITQLVKVDTKRMGRSWERKSEVCPFLLCYLFINFIINKKKKIPRFYNLFFNNDTLLPYICNLKLSK